MYALRCPTYPGSFLVRQLHSANVSTKGGIVICEIVTTIAICFGVEPNAEDRVPGCEQLDQAAFEIMNFRKIEAARICWIYPGDLLFSLPNVHRTTLLHRGNLYRVPVDEEVV